MQEHEQDFVDEGYEDFSAPAAPDPVAAAPDLRRIVTVHPSTYNEARIIGGGVAHVAAPPDSDAAQRRKSGRSMPSSSASTPIT